MRFVMVKLKEKTDLEKALDTNAEPQISKEQEISYHQGALNTLVAERNELFKMIQNVEVIMQAHLKRLEELGVKIQTGQKPVEGKK